MIGRDHSPAHAAIAETPQQPDFTSAVLPAGMNTIEVFYADRHTSGAFLSLNLETSGVVITPPTSGVPEVSTWAMLLVGFAGLGLAGYRQSRKASVA